MENGGRREGYRLRRVRDGRGLERFYLTVPRRVAELLPPDGRYECLLTDEGVLFRPVGEAPPAELPPAWTREGRA